MNGRRVAFLIGVMMLLTVSTVTEAQEDNVGRYGRGVDRAFQVVSYPGGKVGNIYHDVAEFFVLDYMDYEAELWYEVAMMDGRDGWVRADTVVLADESNEDYRVYGEECVFTPVRAERVDGAGILDEYQHTLRFADSLMLDNRDAFALYFNEAARDMDIEIWTDHELALPALWVLQHSGFRPRWSEEQYWQLIGPCEELLA